MSREQTKISSISFIGNDNVRSKRLRDVIASEEDKFWKVISRNTNLKKPHPIRFKALKTIINLYYDIKVGLNLAQINKAGRAELVYSIDEGKGIQSKRFQQMKESF